MVSEKLSLKNWKFYKECITHKRFCHPDISQFSVPDISFNIASKELKIAQIARQVNQIFSLLNVARIYGHGFHELSRIIANEEKCN